MKRFLSLLLTAAMLSALLVACAPPSASDTDSNNTGHQNASDTNTTGSEDTAASEDTLTVALGTEPISMDPHVGNDSNTCTALMLSLEGLLNTVDGEIVPGMAETYEISEDGTVYTFHLRDAAWQDGKPVTARDFVDTYVRMLTRQDAMDLAYLIFPIKNAAAVNSGEMDASELGCKAIDDKT